MNIKRKLPAFCLAVIMVLTVLPRSAFSNGEAAETPPVDADGYYLLDSAEDLYWFSGFVNGRTDINDKVNARLAADIDLNPGISFAYNHETGKITVSTIDTNIGSALIEICVPLARSDTKNGVINGERIVDTVVIPTEKATSPPQR